MSELRSFGELAVAPDARLDLLALAIAQEFRDVDGDSALETLDDLGAELAHAAAQTTGEPDAVARCCGQLLGVRHGFRGRSENYDDPDNSMLDLVLSRRRGLPILLSVVYIEVGRRAGVPLGGIGLPGHFVVAHCEAGRPLLLDPFNGGQLLSADVAAEPLRPWRSHEIAMRMLNNLIAAYHRRANLTAAIHAARMRLRLPAETSRKIAIEAELRALEARLN
ncbi:MAG: transglutaminase family protein [Solirubrobacterales bacterium]|nr:transglutaminase family protein [Solirubrobacterales bacterium]MBV9716791.1 transglutaminase family protein [Solirubrobacterales bacterium]